MDMAALTSRLKAGEIILGGCDIHPNLPKWHCNKCSHEWGGIEWPSSGDGLRMQRETEEAKAEQAAEARGVFYARANKNGYVKCPYCQRSFSIRYPMSWNGKMHKSCRTRIVVVE